MPRTRMAVMFGELLQFAQTITPETTAGNSLLEHEHARLRALLEEIEKLNSERDAYAAKKQEATRRINEALDESRRLATVLRSALRQAIGPREEKLATFRIQPFRGRKRARKSDPAAASPSSPDGDPLP